MKLKQGNHKYKTCTIYASENPKSAEIYYYMDILIIFNQKGQKYVA